MRASFLSPLLEGMDLEGFMHQALLEAEKAGLAGEIPIGAVLVIDGQIITRGRNQNQLHRSQLMHAELNALLSGGESLWERYKDAILFTTVEPCPMCLGAVVMADVPHIVFASHDEVVHSHQTIAANPYVRRHIQSYFGGVLEEEAHELMSRFNPRLVQYIKTGTSAES